MSTEYRIRFEDGEVVITRRSWRDVVDRPVEVQKTDTITTPPAPTPPVTRPSISLPTAYPWAQMLMSAKAAGGAASGGGQGGSVCCGGGITVVFGSVNMRCSASSSDLGSGEGDDPSSGGVPH